MNKLTCYTIMTAILVALLAMPAFAQHEGNTRGHGEWNRARHNNGNGEGHTQWRDMSEDERAAMRTRREERMEQLREENPEAYENMVQMRELGSEIRDLANSLREADESEKEAITAALRGKVGEMLDLRNEVMAQRIAQFEAQLAEMKEKQESFAAHRDSMVDDRMAKIMERIANAE